MDWNQVAQIAIATLLSTGILTTLVTLIIQHNFDKVIRTHEVKIEKYFRLIEEFAKYIGSEADWDKLRPLLNEALLFASDKVCVEILKFSQKFEQARIHDKGIVSAKDIEPLIIAIRKDLYLKSVKMKKEDGHR